MQKKNEKAYFTLPLPSSPAFLPQQLRRNEHQIDRNRVPVLPGPREEKKNIPPFASVDGDDRRKRPDVEKMMERVKD